MSTVMVSQEPHQPGKADWGEQTWSARRERHKTGEKRLMAQYCAVHDFLVRKGLNPETDQRETVASILVNQGTTPNIVVEEALLWIEKNQDRGPFDITWYTPGHLIPATLRSFRLENPQLLLGTQLFLFPGRVDPQFESVAGPDAETFAENLQRRFTYAFLSANSFDINTGIVYFHLPEEVRLQRACATCYAAHKFLFLDSTKFKSDGEIGYSIEDLLGKSEAVTIYTVASEKDEWIKAKFDLLCSKVLELAQPSPMSVNGTGLDGRDVKSLTLRIVGTEHTPTDSISRKGFLRASR